MKATPGLILLLSALCLSVACGDMVSELTARAESGDPNAQLELAATLDRGKGVAKNTPEAVKWYSKAAEQGSVEAQLALGGMYVSGKGVRRNSTEAAKWFSMGAEKGNAAAQCQLARMHMSGAGVSKDDMEAYKWANLASAQGDNSAKQILSILGQRMTPAQIADAQKRSRDFLDSSAVPKIGEPPADPVEPAPPLELPE